VTKPSRPAGLSFQPLRFVKLAALSFHGIAYGKNSCAIAGAIDRHIANSNDIRSNTMQEPSMTENENRLHDDTADNAEREAATVLG
jgi:hypothetical protein